MVIKRRDWLNLVGFDRPVPRFTATYTKNFNRPAQKMAKCQKFINLWPNRLIGDLQPGAHQYTFALIQPFKPDSPLFPSGLLGPVRIIAERR